MELTTDTTSDTPGIEAALIRGLVEGLAMGCLLPWHRWALPPLYQSGVQARLEPGHGTGRDTLVVPPEVYRRGWGDCAHLVVWRLAELNCDRWRWHNNAILWVASPATCKIEWEGLAMHVLVRRPDGKLEDPMEVLS